MKKKLIFICIALILTFSLPGYGVANSSINLDLSSPKSTYETCKILNKWDAIILSTRCFSHKAKTMRVFKLIMEYAKKNKKMERISGNRKKILEIEVAELTKIFKRYVPEQDDEIFKEFLKSDQVDYFIEEMEVYFPRRAFKGETEISITNEKNGSVIGVEKRLQNGRLVAKRKIIFVLIDGEWLVDSVK